MGYALYFFQFPVKLLILQLLQQRELQLPELRLLLL